MVPAMWNTTKDSMEIKLQVIEDYFWSLFKSQDKHSKSRTAN
jgi:hypothetical protein